MIGLQEVIRPSADLRNHYPEISKVCRENREAIIFTVNGRGDTVSLSYEEYQNMKARIEILEIVARSEEDFKNGRVYSVEESYSKAVSAVAEGRREVQN